MIIKEIYIDAFGKLKNQRFVFNEGLNSLLRDNGEGKTTLTVFIKAMLYGPEDTKRVVSENERKRYRPWWGGDSSGYIVFSTEAGEFRLERSFGQKSSEDTMTVYNTKTGAVCHDFGECPGQAIFGIDREGFERTVFLSEKLLSGPIENNSITGKLSNLVGVEYDISEFDKAIKSIEDAKRHYFKRGGGGEIGELKGNIAYSEAELRRLSEKDLEYAELRKKEAELRASLAEKKLKISALENEYEQNIKLNTDAALKGAALKRYTAMKTALDEERLELSELNRLFSGKVPTEADIEAATRHRVSAELQAEVLNNRRIEADELFSKIPSEERLRHFERVITEKPTVRTSPIPFILMGCGIILMCLCFLFMPLIAPGAVLLGIGILWYFSSKKRQGRLSDEIAELYEYAKGCYREPLSDLSPEELLAKITRDRAYTLDNIKEMERISEAQARQAREKELADRFFSSFNIPERELLSTLTKYKSLAVSIEAKQRELELYKSENSIDDSTAGAAAAAAPIVERSISTELNSHREAVLELERQITSLGELCLRLSRELEEKENIIEQISAYKERLQYCEERLAILTKTAELLSLAKDNMTSKYLGGTGEAFIKYLRHFGETADFTIDTSFGIKRSDIGGSRESELYSKGQRELYAFAMRLALIDALYENEYPPLIIDDAFLSLDGGRLTKMKELIKSLSKNRQIIYLTCHESRSIS